MPQPRPLERSEQPPGVLGESVEVVDEERRAALAGERLGVAAGDRQPAGLDVQAGAGPPGRGGLVRADDAHAAWAIGWRDASGRRDGPAGSTRPRLPAIRTLFHGRPDLLEEMARDVGDLLDGRLERLAVPGGRRAVAAHLANELAGGRLDLTCG